MNMFNPYKEIDLDELNQIIDNIARSRWQGVDYSYIDDLSLKLLRNIPREKLGTSLFEYKANVSKEDTINIALDFFRNLDEDFYQKAKRIIDGNSTDIRIIWKEHQSDSESMEIASTNKPVVEHGSLGTNIYIPLQGNIEDIYSIVHEISHTFDAPERPNKAHMFLAEITSHVFERMLDCYLEKRVETDKKEYREDVSEYKRESLMEAYYSAVEYHTKYKAFDYKNENGELTTDDIPELMKHFREPPDLIMFYLKNYSQGMSYSSRYVLGGIVSYEFLQKYKKNPQKSIRALKKYMELSREDKLWGALKKLGVSMDISPLKVAVDEEYSKNIMFHNSGKDEIQ